MNGKIMQLLTQTFQFFFAFLSFHDAWYQLGNVELAADKGI